MDSVECMYELVTLSCFPNCVHDIKHNTSFCYSRMLFLVTIMFFPRELLLNKTEIWISVVL
jgi:hypothetical protein